MSDAAANDANDRKAWSITIDARDIAAIAGAAVFLFGAAMVHLGLALMAVGALMVAGAVLKSR